MGQSLCGCLDDDDDMGQSQSQSSSSDNQEEQSNGQPAGTTRRLMSQVKNRLATALLQKKTTMASNSTETAVEAADGGDAVLRDNNQQQSSVESDADNGAAADPRQNEDEAAAAAAAMSPPSSYQDDELDHASFMLALALQEEEDQQTARAYAIREVHRDAGAGEGAPNENDDEADGGEQANEQQQQQQPAAAQQNDDVNRALALQYRTMYQFQGRSNNNNVAAAARAATAARQTHGGHPEGCGAAARDTSVEGMARVFVQRVLDLVPEKEEEADDTDDNAVLAITEATDENKANAAPAAAGAASSTEHGGQQQQKAAEAGSEAKRANDAAAAAAAAALTSEEAPSTTTNEGRDPDEEHSNKRLKTDPTMATTLEESPSMHMKHPPPCGGGQPSLAADGSSESQAAAPVQAVPCTTTTKDAVGNVQQNGDATATAASAPAADDMELEEKLSSQAVANASTARRVLTTPHSQELYRLAVALFNLQDKFHKAGKPFDVDLAFSYDDEVEEEEKRDDDENEAAAKLSTWNELHQEDKNKSTTVRLVARLKGSDGVDFSSDERDSIVLHDSAQCLRLMEFPSALLNNIDEDMMPTTIAINGETTSLADLIGAYRREIQTIVNDLFNAPKAPATPPDETIAVAPQVIDYTAPDLIAEDDPADLESYFVSCCKEAATDPPVGDTTTATEPECSSPATPTDDKEVLPDGEHSPPAPDTDTATVASVKDGDVVGDELAGEEKKVTEADKLNTSCTTVATMSSDTSVESEAAMEVENDPKPSSTGKSETMEGTDATINSGDLPSTDAATSEGKDAAIEEAEKPAAALKDDKACDDEIEEDASNECSICLNPMTTSCSTTPGCARNEDSVVSLKICGHSFHYGCIQYAWKLCSATNRSNLRRCPMCRVTVGKPRHGDMPSGTMTISLNPDLTCDGYWKGTLLIDYKFESGIQKEYHENPQVAYGGTKRRAFLPYTLEGQALLKRLVFAFEHGLSFTIGTSLPNQQPNSITWASIPHKTSISGGPFGFPDPGYFINAHEELDQAGVPPADILAMV